MGRGVDRLSNAAGVTYFDVSSHGYHVGWGDWTCPKCDDRESGYESEPMTCSECKVSMTYEAYTDYDQDQGQMDWDDFKDNIIATLQKRYPSLETATGWDDETSIILENTFCEIGIAEYCGCASLSIRVKDVDGYYDRDTSGLAAHWVDVAWTGMIAALDKEMPWANRLNRLGTFSNGESVYQLANR